MVTMKLLETMFSYVETSSSVRGLLQGDRNGTVDTISLSPLMGGQKHEQARLRGLHLEFYNKKVRLPKAKNLHRRC